MRIQTAALHLGMLLSLITCSAGGGGSNTKNSATSENITVTIGKFGASISGTYARWWGGVKGPDGMIYGVPFGENDILVIDPLTSTAIRSTMGANLSGSSKWASGCLGPDGKIYCVPYDAPDVLVIDTVAKRAYRTNFDQNLTDLHKWAGGVLGADYPDVGVFEMLGKCYEIETNCEGNLAH